MRPPVKLGPSKSLFGTLHGKSAVVQSFANERTKVIYDYVVFGGPPVTTVVFALTDGKEVIAVKQYRHGAEDFSLELPGGVPGDGEMAEENARALKRHFGDAVLILVGSADAILGEDRDVVYQFDATMRRFSVAFIFQSQKRKERDADADRR